jgi:hypothetical protein
MTNLTRQKTATTVTRVSILTFPRDQLAAAEQLMIDGEESLKGILKLKGLQSYFAGVDRVTGQLTNVSVWDSAENAQQMSTFQPMLDLAAKCLELNGTFLRPIPNFEQLWKWEI